MINITSNINKAFKKNQNIETLSEEANTKCSYHLYVIKVKDAKTRLKLFNHLREKEIYCQVHYIPIYRQPFYKKQGYSNKKFPNIDEMYNRIISIPLYPDLFDEEQNSVIKAIGDFFE